MDAQKTVDGSKKHGKGSLESGHLGDRRAPASTFKKLISVISTNCLFGDSDQPQILSLQKRRPVEQKVCVCVLSLAIHHRTS